MSQIEPLTEQQLIGLCGLQQSTHEAEEALSQGLGALNQSLSDTIAADSLSYPSNMGNYMGQMAAAISKLSTLEGFVRQVRSPIQLISRHIRYYSLTIRVGIINFWLHVYMSIPNSHRGYYTICTNMH